MKTLLGIFCKQPIPGNVKTRLAHAIGDEPAARLYEAFLTDIVNRLRTACDRRILCYAPDAPTSPDYFQRLASPHYESHPQTTGDLGDRLTAFFEIAFLTGADKVIVIGSDSPTITPAEIEQARIELDRFDAVLGRSDDGGYYLIGLRRNAHSDFTNPDDPNADRVPPLPRSSGPLSPNSIGGEGSGVRGHSEPLSGPLTPALSPAQSPLPSITACGGEGAELARAQPTQTRITANLFAGIDWSTPAVYDQQHSRLSAAGFTTSTLPPIPEVDTLADLDRLRDHPLLPQSPHTHRVLSEIPRS